MVTNDLVPEGIIERFPPGPGEGVGGQNVGRAEKEDDPDAERRRRARLKDADPAPSFGAVAQAIPIAPGVQRAQAQYQEALKQRSANVAPQIEATQQALAQPRPPVEAPPTLPPPPSLGLTPFLAPVEGERPENTIAKLIQGVGLLAVGVAGRKDARASLAALTGALKGWQEGDKERADRHFADWQAQSDTLLRNWKTRRETWRDIMDDRALSQADRNKMLELSLLKEGLPLDVAKANLEGEVYLQGEVDKWIAHTDSVGLQMATLGQHKLFGDQAAEDRKARQAETARHNREIEDARRLAEEEKLNAVAPHPAYDYEKGMVRQVTKREEMENAQALQAGKPATLRSLPAQQVQLLERLAVAPPILDRLDKLIDKINAVAPGENITQGLINRLRRRAGVSADMQEIMTLNLDNALENAAALSGGQPRIAILNMLRGEATPNEFMTAETAHRAVATTRTTIYNRGQTMTGDPDTIIKMAQELRGYGPRKESGSAAPDNDPLGIRR